jgi:uncharacterized protein (DUF342 family)
LKGKAFSLDYPRAMRVIHKVDDDVKLLELSLSDDKQKLFARVEPRDKHQEVLLDDIVKEILSVSRVDLLEKDVVRDIVEELRKGNGCDARRVAQGRPPADGRDGKIVWLARRFRPGEQESGEREFSDFFTLGLFENIEVGAEVARIYKPANGTAGVDAQGNDISAKAGKAVTARWDKSIELRSDPEHENYLTAVATIAGYIHDEGSSVAIRDTLNIPGNLDWAFGHIDFVGNVIVGGDVQKGFHIKARGDITIRGNVIGESILTSQRSITIKGSHQGAAAYAVSAGGDYTAGIANSVSVTAGGSIYIEREARDCSFNAGLSVIAPKANLVGGSIWCVQGVEVKVLGNEAGVTTLVEIKNELEVTKEYRTLSAAIKKHEAAVAALELHIGPYLKNRRRVPLLKKEFRVKIAGLLQKYDSVVTSLGQLRQKEREMRESKPVKSDARIIASAVVHPGVVLTSGESRFEIKEEIKGPISLRRPDHQSEWVIESIKKG